MFAPIDTLAVGGMLLIATWTDLRTRDVPGWLTFGGIGSGIVLATMNGVDALFVCLLGTLIGVSIILPFILIGAFGAADALLLAAIGAWKGPEFVLWTVWWMSLVGAALAVCAWRRGQTTFPYVPAIAVGTCFTVLTT